MIAINLHDGSDPPSLPPPYSDGLDLEPDDSIAAWLAVLSSFLVSFTCMGVSSTFGVYQEEYLARVFRGSSVPAVSLVGAVQAGLMYGLGPVVGPVAERHGGRRLMVAGTTVMSAGMIIAGFSTRLWQLYLTQAMLVGIGASMVYFPAMAAASQWFQSARLPTIFPTPSETARTSNGLRNLWRGPRWPDHRADVTNANFAVRMAERPAGDGGRHLRAANDSDNAGEDEATAIGGGKLEENG
ncbi:major facilitator superfamily domain-containing protein [Jimgerdemannia flammicorona]|uniref:Major facilitator superfamily domain-containing protein n=1 Tax=Jimgerdemannia flammicorona TaxID=994334 RepID=A0A433CY11_9FUNG|nr:major facilitator superfamily domain-containing protein [Jimgerdemannia flammicorona]